MKRLCQATLHQLPATVVLPRYERSSIGAGLLHIGVGAFHRAHQALYTDTVINEQGGSWGIIGASLRSNTASEQLMPQDCLYTLVERDNDRQSERVIGALQSIMVATENPSALIELIAATHIKIVSLTITEKGYHYNPESNGLHTAHPEVLHDLQHFRSAPITAIGFIVAGLALRKQQRHTGITLLSCDNLPHNGTVLRKVITDFAMQTDAELSSWIDDNVSFPSTMIDRIVPATTQRDLDLLAMKMGIEDRAAIFTEPFTQWIIEDNFVAGRPEWECAGALLVDKVTPFEEAKLRLLNGSHSLIAYLGNVAGYDFVHQVVGDADFRELIRHYMDEVIPGLDVPDHFDTVDYRKQLLARFSNSSLNHRTAQIAQDGSQKIPQRWFSTLNNARCTQLNTHALAFAGWIHYLTGKRDNNEQYSVIDPLAADLQTIARSDGTSAVAPLLRRLGLGSITTSHPTFMLNATQHLQQLQQQSVKQVIRQFNSTASAEI
jgi:fructuronate reductase